MAGIGDVPLFRQEKHKSAAVIPVSDNTRDLGRIKADGHTHDFGSYITNKAQ